MLKYVITCCIFWLSGVFPLSSQEHLFLKDNLSRAQAGDYLVLAMHKTYTVMHIYDKQPPRLIIEEITIPENNRKSFPITWREWVEKGAPGHTSWVRYEVNLQSGQLSPYYSFDKKGWYEIPDADNFLAKLLSFQFTPVSDRSRRKIGPRPGSGPDMRALWQPPLILNGHLVKNIEFSAWETRWPKDNTELSGKTVQIYLPKDSERYPAYFPYWLQISGNVGKAHVHLVDSGRALKSPQPSQLPNRF